MNCSSHFFIVTHIVKFFYFTVKFQNFTIKEVSPFPFPRWGKARSRKKADSVQKSTFLVHKLSINVIIIDITFLLWYNSKRGAGSPNGRLSPSSRCPWANRKRLVRAFSVTHKTPTISAGVFAFIRHTGGNLSTSKTSAICSCRRSCQRCRRR